MAKAVITFLPEVCFAVADAVGSVTLGALVIVFVGIDGGVGVSRVVVGIGATAVVVLAGEEIVVAVSVALCMVVAVGGAVTVLVGIAGSGVDVRVGIAVAVFVAVGGICVSVGVLVAVGGIAVAVLVAVGGIAVAVLVAVGGIAVAVLVAVGTIGVAVAARGLVVAVDEGMFVLVGVIVGTVTGVMGLILTTCPTYVLTKFQLNSAQPLSPHPVPHWFSIQTPFASYLLAKTAWPPWKVR